MPIVRRTRAEVDAAAVAAELRAQPEPDDAAIEAAAAEDDSAWSDEDFAQAEILVPPPTPAEVKALRARLGLSQPQFARRFGFSVSAIRQYEYGRRSPKGPATTLLRVIQADPEAVARALRGR
ncbi:MAG TPA: helix-turn-helix domain-containing protein [Caulobacteraceae bacterium]|nr:helix-turn-helix domain-containing protein [Caulobacteraceae bacterium]